MPLITLSLFTLLDIEYLNRNNCSFDENIQIKLNLIQLIQHYIKFFSCKCPFTSILDIIQQIQKEENLLFIQQIKKQVKEPLIQ